MEPDPRFDEIRRLGGERYRAYLDAGFQEYYTGPTNEAIKGTPFLLQKRVRSKDFGDTLYFLDVWVYGARPWRDDMPVAYQPEFHSKRDGIDFSVTMIKSDATPLEVELFFGDVYWDLGCSPYDEG